MEIPRRYYGKSFENFDASRAGVEIDALKQSLRHNETVFIKGDVGHGKTHLAVALMCDWFAWKYSLTAKKSDALFLPCTDLFWKIKRAFDDKTEGTAADVLDRYKSAELLVVDDLGAHGITDWRRGDVLMPLFDHRYRECLATIVTTNLNLDQINEQIDPRIASRLVEMGPIVTLRGGDERLARALSTLQ
jgi:DNA replication protein DnaC